MSSGPSAAVSQETDALLVVDVQNDFARPGGSLYIAGGEALTAPINAVSRGLSFRLQVCTQDWHPADHSSFRERGGPWPPHCVAGSDGAALCAGLDTGRYDLILRKGGRQEVDCNSAFCDAAGATTGLHGMLADAGVTRVLVVGLALDVCVAATVRDALAAGLQVVILADCCRSVSGDDAAATADLLAIGTVVMNSTDFL